MKFENEYCDICESLVLLKTENVLRLEHQFHIFEKTSFKDENPVNFFQTTHRNYSFCSFDCLRKGIEKIVKGEPFEIRDKKPVVKFVEI